MYSERRPATHRIILIRLLNVFGRETTIQEVSQPGVGKHHIVGFSHARYDPDCVFKPTNTTSTAAYAAVLDSTSISLSR
jgi:hypothetical protein